MLRKPTFVVFWIGIVLVLLYGVSRYDLVRRCPDLRGKIPVLSEAATLDGSPYNLSLVMCTNQDPTYVDMEDYEIALEMCFVALVVLVITDMVSFSLGDSRKLRHRRRKKGSKRKGNKFLVLLSKFFGGL